MYQCSVKRKGFVFAIDCEFKTAGYYYTFVCYHDPAYPAKKLRYKCDKRAHYINYDGLCCRAANDSCYP